MKNLEKKISKIKKRKRIEVEEILRLWLPCQQTRQIFLPFSEECSPQRLRATQPRRCHENRVAAESLALKAPVDSPGLMMGPLIWQEDSRPSSSHSKPAAAIPSRRGHASRDTE